MQESRTGGATIDFAIVGCGYVADYYMQTLRRRTGVRVVRAMDCDATRVRRFGTYWSVETHPCLETFFSGLKCDLILNLTNPSAHYTVTKMCLAAGYSVYSEKPLALSFAEVEELAEFARAKRLTLASAPCNHLGEAAQATKRAIAQRRIGVPLIAYAEMDDKLMAKVPYRNWRSVSGVPWPFADEFNVGCTLEHAAYYVTWLVFLFGSVAEIVSCASLQYPGKPTGGALEASDFSIAVLKFRSGVAARLTCSILAPIDRSLRVYGDEGELRAEDAWSYAGPVTYRRWTRFRRGVRLSPWKNKVALDRGPVPGKYDPSLPMDFIRGPIEVVAAAREGRRSRLPLDFCVHVNEVTLAIHESATTPGLYQVRTTCEPVTPLGSRYDSDSKLGFFDRTVPIVLDRLFRR